MRVHTVNRFHRTFCVCSMKHHQLSELGTCDNCRYIVTILPCLTLPLPGRDAKKIVRVTAFAKHLIPSTANKSQQSRATTFFLYIALSPSIFSKIGLAQGAHSREFITTILYSVVHIQLIPPYMQSSHLPGRIMYIHTVTHMQSQAYSHNVRHTRVHVRYTCMKILLDCSGNAGDSISKPANYTVQLKSVNYISLALDFAACGYTYFRYFIVY